MPGARSPSSSIFVNPLQFGAERGPGALPPPAGSRPRRLPRGGRRAGVHAGGGGHVPGGRRHRRHPGALGDRAGGRGAAGPLPRRAHGRVQALPHRRPGRGVLRREGLPAARPRPEDGARPGLPALDRRGADRARARRAGAVLAQRLPLARGAAPARWCCPGRCGPGRRWPRAAPTPCWRPPARCSPRSPRWPSTTWSCAPPTSAPRRRAARPGCWWPRGSARPG